MNRFAAFTQEERSRLGDAIYTEIEALSNEEFFQEEVNVLEKLWRELDEANR